MIESGYLPDTFLQSSRLFIMRVSTSLLIGVTVSLMGAGPLAVAREVDENGHLIATPREAAMMERGFLFYPIRVLRKPGAPKDDAEKTGTDKPTASENLIKPVTTPVPAPTSLATQSPAPAAVTPSKNPDPPAEPVAKAPEPGIAEEMVKVEPPLTETAPVAPATPAVDKIMITQPNKRLSGPAMFEQITAYVGAGTGVVVGMTVPQPSGHSVRVEYSDNFKTLDMSAHDGGGRFKSSNVQQRVGLFVDWSPNHDNWFLTGGVTLNEHRFKLQSRSADTLTINGKSVVFTGETLNIDYALPTFTPYIGVRYVHRPYNNKGWEGFAELGLIASKMNTVVNVSQTLLDSGQVSDSDLQAEARNIRKSIYRWDVVPNAVVGLSYRY